MEIEEVEQIKDFCDKVKGFNNIALQMGYNLDSLAENLENLESFIKDLEGFLSDTKTIANFGIQSGINGFITNKEILSFYDSNKEKIIKTIEEYAFQCGDSIETIIKRIDPELNIIKDFCLNNGDLIKPILVSIYVELSASIILDYADNIAY